MFSTDRGRGATCRFASMFAFPVLAVCAWTSAGVREALMDFGEIGCDASPIPAQSRGVALDASPPGDASCWPVQA